MQYPQDGGLSCVRYSLDDRGGTGEVWTRGRMRSPHRVVGTLVCQCSAEEYWSVSIGVHEPVAYALCRCNGSGLPIVVGPYRKVPSNGVPPCTRLQHDRGRDLIIVGVGYSAELPKKPTVAQVESASELIVVAHCLHCEAPRIAMHHKLDRPFPVNPDGTWLRKIQGAR